MPLNTSLKLPLLVWLKLVCDTTKVSLPLKLPLLVLLKLVCHTTTKKKRRKKSLSLKLPLLVWLKLVYDTTKVSLSLKLAHHWSSIQSLLLVYHTTKYTLLIKEVTMPCNNQFKTCCVKLHSLIQSRMWPERRRRDDSSVVAIVKHLGLISRWCPSKCSNKSNISLKFASSFFLILFFFFFLFFFFLLFSLFFSPYRWLVCDITKGSAIIEVREVRGIVFVM